MIDMRKFNGERSQELACAIMIMRNNGTNLTSDEMKDLINHTYYLYDTVNCCIPAVISGKRIMLKDEYAGEEIRFVNQYIITDFLYDKLFFANYDESDTASYLCYLVREFDADKNDWSIRYDIPDPEKEDQTIKRALRTNGYIKHSSGKYYLRVLKGIDFQKLRS